jgi:DNA modification methylase
MKQHNIKIEYVPIGNLKQCEYNPRKFSVDQKEQLKESITRFGVVDPLLVNSADERKNIVVGGNLRLNILKELEYTEVPVVFLSIPDVEKEKELNIRLNKNGGEFDNILLSQFDESFLTDIGFDSTELDSIFEEESTEEMFDLQRELDKLHIEVQAHKGDVYDLDGSRLMVGDSCIESDMLKLMGDNTADLCLTDPPYILDYLKGKSRGKNGPTVGFGAKKNRRYLETDVLPDNFSDLWMANVAKVQKPDFSIIIFENPKNLRTIWNALEVHWKYRNTITWHVPNRMQGFSASNKFFNKTDIALVGSSGTVDLNLDDEDALFQNEYENALFATSGKAYFEPYEKGKKICPTDFISHTSADEKSSGQAIIFGTKPVELLIPYIKVLTKRNDLVLEPFGGSGSTLVSSLMLGRCCFIMEKSPVYAEVILNRWEKYTGKKRKKIT